MAGKRGGARPGAGRKKGGVNKLSAEAIKRAKETGVMPADVLLEGTRYYWKRATAEIAKGKNADEDAVTAAMEKAHTFATAASPYFHNRLSAVEHKGAPGGADLWSAMMAHAEEHARSADKYHGKADKQRQEPAGASS